MKFEKFKIISITIIGLAIPFWVLWKNVFPSFEYEFNLSRDNRNKISEKIINEKGYIIFPVDMLDIQSDYQFSKISLTLRFQDKIAPEEIKIEAADGFETLLYSIGNPIENKEQLNSLLKYNNDSVYPNGSIIAHDDSAYFISRGRYLPIFSSDVFTQNGFFWEKLIQADSDVFSKMEEGDKFHYYSPHPDGTILRINKKNYYLVWEEKLLPIEDNLLLETWPNFNWADVETIKNLTGNCHSRSSGRKMSCNFNDNSERIGNAYIFEIKESSRKIEKIEIDLKTSKDKGIKESFLFFLSRIKNNLIYKYGKHL